MATSINAPLTGDRWHLSIEDLLEPLVERPRLGGPGPFVINLAASSAPLELPAKELTAAPGAQVYQIQRLEDRRPRYRLRLGPFVSEDEAEAVLAIVRDVYPGALTATADGEDLRALAALKPRSGAAVPVAAAPPPVVPVAAAPPPGVSVPVAPPAKPLAAPRAGSIPVLSDSVAPVVRPAAKSEAASPASGAPARGAAAAAPMRAAPSFAAAARPPMGAPVARPAAAAPRHADAPAIASLDSTQTLRVLTMSELQDSGPRWYVIQLSLSREGFDPDSLPNLDIFNEYRLYSVAGLDQGHIVHALRLGFFAEEGAAAMVARYLGEFYDKPTVKRISVAERERFRDQRVEARKDIGATGRHAVIEITGDMHVREKRPHIASVTPLAPAAALAQSTAVPGRKPR